ncbi:ROK family protein [Herbiconiux sp. L3-i23]|uniref:ROK family protein n=1 Tax=Herbiconiux sp. L3-i23 TaxID=2905871 RepID=UPI00206AAB4F|nr:ROK family protein [Herbiconiux sp. L3-i23]BDI22074.1 glucokinase [Herbiconiux sp. L3-i23]
MPLALAVDLGGTKVEAALVDENGSLLSDTRHRRPTGADATTESLTAAVEDVVTAALAASPDGAIPVGAGVGSAGPIDIGRGSVAPLNLSDAQDFPIRRIVRDAATAATGTEIATEFALDGLCITLAEHWCGAGRGVQSMMGMIVSTGIGGGIISGGKPLRGSSGNAGHIGQLEVAGFAGEDVHGLRAHVERIASGPNIVRWAQSQGWTGETGEDLAASAANGDSLALAAVTRSAHAVGAAIASATALVDLDMVVIGGGFSHVTPDYLDQVREGRDRYAAFPFMARAEIAPAALGGESPLVGAAALVFGRA